MSDKTHNFSESGTSFRQALYFKEIGFKIYDTMIFAKKNPIPLNHRRYEQQFEYMFIFSKGKPSIYNPLKVRCKDHILSWSNSDNIVMDIFMGSGTVGKVASLNKRKFIGFEISKEYVEIANSRINKMKSLL